ncbi:MAG: hypothetical protein S4CHLAM81_04620 [Chlamydiales bacterium]|nr:hypothetical protein [Chlamydiales bacterium]MCH9635251.1 hypothetical protein [Chlamydiales bacterium]MCH9703457.1 hypothetical protein [Chlamydiota bacterium]
MFRFLIALVATTKLFALSYHQLEEAFPEDMLWEGNGEVMLCMHGFGMDKTISYFVHDMQVAPYHLVGFNFLDHGDNINIEHPEKLSFGTVHELIPIVDRLKKCVLELQEERIHLYGFSAGGGAIVNLLAALKWHRFSEEFGLSFEQMDLILAAIENGSVILDCPLRSVEEIVEVLEPDNRYLIEIGKIYTKNELRPIDTLLKLDGMRLNLLLVLATPDEILSNRDDALFIERAKWVNRLGKTVVVMASEGMHIPCLPSLVEGYQRLIK